MGFLAVINWDKSQVTERHPSQGAVIPAKAGIQDVKALAKFFKSLDPGLCRDDVRDDTLLRLKPC